MAKFANCAGVLALISAPQHFNTAYLMTTLLSDSFSMRALARAL